MRVDNENPRLGYALAASAAILWSTLGVLGKFAYSFGVDPLTVVSLRAAIATLVVGGVIFVTNPSGFMIRRADLPFFLAYGFFGVGLNYIGYFYALKFTTVATAITLLYTYPALVVVVSSFVFHEPVTAGKVAALVLTFLGILFTALGASSGSMAWDPRGIIFGLLAGGGNAVYTLAGKRAQTTYSALTVLFYSFLFGATALCALYFVELGATLKVNAEILLVILVIALVPTLVGYGLYTFSLRFIEAGKSSIMTSIEPAVAIFLAYLFLRETTTSLQLFGTALIIGGVIILQVKK